MTIRNRVGKGVPTGGQFKNERRKPTAIEPQATERLRDWSDLDISDHEIEEWKEAGFTADDAYAWGDGRGCGFYPDQAKEWCGVGIHDPYEADQWSSHGFTPEEMVEWARNGFMSFSKDQPALWRDCGFSDPSEAGAWRKAGFNHAQALSWKEAELSPAEAKLEAKSTVDKFHHIPDMYEHYTPQEIWGLEDDVDCDASYNSRNETNWRRLGFSPYAVHDWESAGYGPAQAAELREQLLADRVKATQDVLEARAKTEDAHQRYIDRERQRMEREVAYVKADIENKVRAARAQSRHHR